MNIGDDTSREEPTYAFSKIFQKLCEIKKILGRRGRPLDPPLNMKNLELGSASHALPSKSGTDENHDHHWIGIWIIGAFCHRSYSKLANFCNDFDII